MTVASDVARVDYYGTGSVGPFPVPFYFIDNADILVVKTEVATGAAVNLTLTTDYTLTGAGVSFGGALTLVAVLPATHKITIVRDPARVQLTDYTPNDKFPAESHERILDRIVMMIQRVYEVVSRAIRMPEGESTISVLPKRADRAGKYLSFDGAGNVTASPGTNAAVTLSSLTFLQAGAGAIARTAESKMRDKVSVKDFGAIGNGIADDFPAMVAAIAAVSAVGGEVFFPNGVYRIGTVGGILQVSGSSVSLVGESKYGVQIAQENLGISIVYVTGPFCRIEHLSMYYSGTPVPGAAAIFISGTPYFYCNDIVVRNSDVGFLNLNSSGYMSNFEILDYGSTGIHVEGANDFFFVNFILNAGNTARGVLGGIRLKDKAEAINFVNGDILLGKYGLITEAAAYTFGNRPAYNNFTNVYFDSYSDSCSITNTVQTTFHDCWFSGGRTGILNDGLLVNQSENIRFIGSMFFDNGAAGCKVNSVNAVKLVFDACSFEGNSITSGAGVSPGLDIIAGAADFIVSNCTSHSNGFGTQGYGMSIGAGADHYSVIGNNFRGNLTGGLLVTTHTADGNIFGNVDDERFAFTPVVSFVTPGDLAVTYAANGQVGAFTRAGRQVTAEFSIVLSAFTHTTAAGDFIISGFPLLARNITGLGVNGSVSFGGVTKAGYTNFCLRIPPNTNAAKLLASGSGVAAGFVTAADMPTGGAVTVSGTITYST